MLSFSSYFFANDFFLALCVFVDERNWVFIFLFRRFDCREKFNADAQTNSVKSDAYEEVNESIPLDNNEGDIPDIRLDRLVSIEMKFILKLDLSW